MASNYPDDVHLRWNRMFPEELPACPVCDADLVEIEFPPEISCTQCDWFVEAVSMP